MSYRGGNQGCLLFLLIRDEHHKKEDRRYQFKNGVPFAQLITVGGPGTICEIKVLFSIQPGSKGSVGTLSISRTLDVQRLQHGATGG